MPETASGKTSYQVFEIYEGDYTPILQPVEAANDRAAIRTVLSAKTPEGARAPRSNTFVAIPTRSLRPVVVKRETQTILKFEDA